MVADIAHLGAQSANYYLAEVAQDELGVFQAERYYSGHGEAPGYWTGEAAARLGLQGQVTPDQFRALFDGKDPTTGELLGRAHAKNARPAFDLVLRPVKSVSVLWGLGDDRIQRTVEAIHRSCVADALLDLEEEVGTRRGAGGKTRIEGRGLLAAVYGHRQSRAGDPLLHSHIIIANRIQGADGKWTTLDGHDLYHEAMGADATYEVLMRGRLREALGVEWARNERTSQWEIAGIPDELLQRFSQRRAEIELAKESREARGEGWSPKVGQFVAHATRPDKEQVDEQTLRGRWTAAAEGFDVSAAAGQSTGQPVRDKEALFGHLAGPDGITRDKATFDRRDVRDAVRRAGHEATSRDEWTGLSHEFVRDSRVVPILQDGKPRYSTVDLQTCERELVSGAEARRNENVAVVEPGRVRDALASARPLLGDDQQAMVRAITGDGAGVSVAVGRAGTGKTTALGVARDAWARQGVEVRGAAPTGIAATQLEAAAGVQSSTVDSLLLGLDAKTDQLPEGGVLVVDEAGMVGTRKMDRLLERAREASTKVVLVGDERQLQAIDAGGGFRALRQRLGATELTENRRQRSELDRSALELVRQGKGEEALAVYGAGGRVTWARDQGTADAAMLRDWWASFRKGDNAVMLTFLRGDADRLNQAARGFRREAGHLGPDELEIRGRRFAVGDLVVCRKNDRAVGVANGTRGRVEAVDLAGGTMLVKRDDGKHTTLPATYLAKAGTGGGASVAHAYATTTHKTQALTVDQAFLRAGGSMTSEWSYVALSRVRNEARIYGVQPEVETPDGIEKYGARPSSRDQVQAGMSRSEVEQLGVDQHHGAALRHLSVGQLRAERDRLAGELDRGPKSRAAEYRLLKDKRDAAEKAYEQDPSGLNRKAADRAEERFRPVDEHERVRAGWDERTAPARARAQAVTAELGYRTLLGIRSFEIDPPQHLVDELGRPTVEWTAPAREAWRKAAGVIEAYRDRYRSYSDRALDDAPKDFGQRRAWQQTAEVAADAKRAIAGMFEKVAETAGKAMDKSRDAGKATLERVVELGMERRT